MKIRVTIEFETEPPKIADTLLALAYRPELGITPHSILAVHEVAAGVPAPREVLPGFIENWREAPDA
jgi:hypothetical protein